MASVFEIFGEIAINAESAYRTIDRTAGKAKGLTQTFGKVGQAAVKFGKTVIAGSAAAAAGIGVLLKASVGNYAEYEQLVGGVQTLFKDSGAKVMEYANSAYKNAGMSANKYIETVTAFSASLLQSLGGDTDKAADVANMAVTDMSDNANKMGTDITMIQNAYQGFAKQNFTMLDNLKLGYGGTKTEMNRLLKDAQKIQKANGKNVKYSIKNMDDIIEAINVIQTEMGITGTTAAEANDTISGSLATLGSAWENVLIGMSDSNADMDALFNNVFLAAENVAKNIGKVLPVFAKNLGQMISSLGQYAGNKIKTTWSDVVWPKIQSAFKVHFGIDLPDWNSTLTSLSTWWTNVSSPVLTSVQQFATDVSNAFAQIATWATGDGAKLIGIVGGIAAAFWLAGGAVTFLSNPIGLLAASVLLLATNWDTVKTAVDDAFNTTVSWLTTNVGAPLETFRANVIVPIANAWTSTVVPAISSAVTAVDDFLGLSLVDGWNDLTNAIQSAWNNIKATVDSVTEAINKLLGLGGNEGLGSEDAAPWYVRQHSDKYSKYDTGDGENPTGEVDLNASEDSEGNIQKDVDGYGLEGDVMLDAASGSQAQIQGALNSMNLTADVILKPKMKFGGGAGAGFDIPGFATGLDRVPEDNFLARLHKDEAVLTSSEAAIWRGEKQPRASAFNRRNTRETSDQPITVNLTVNGNSGSPYEIAGAVRDALEMVRWGV